jgi:transcriptional regulator with XRE-family HTH domain
MGRLASINLAFPRHSLTCTYQMRIIYAMNYEIGNIIKAERKKRGWDQAALAQRLGGEVRQQAISGWERGNSRPKREMVARLAELFEVEAEGLLKASGYLSPTANYPENTMLPVRPRVTTLPLAEIPFDRFEQFSTDLVRMLHSDCQVHRYGGVGHKQYGVDIVAQKGNVYHKAYQCKRHAQFGPANVKEAIDEIMLSAEGYCILLTRVATPGARDEIKNHAGWELWDVEDISREIRSLPLESAVRIVDTYFPGWREPFLGVPEPSAWQTVEEFYRRFSGDQIFTHDWPLVGRATILEAIRQFLADKQPIGVVSSRGGSGKTRLLREVADRAGKDHFIVRFLETGKDVKPENYKLLPRDGKLLVIIDDAHERSDIAEMIAGITRVNTKAKILLAIRPYGFSQLAYDLRRIAVYSSELPTWALEDLTLSEAQELALNVLEGQGSEAIAQRLAHLTRDCPLITVVGAGLIKRGQLNPSKLENDDSIRKEILLAFRDALVVDPTKGEPRVLRNLLNAIAITQPVLMRDENFTGALATLTGRHFVELLPYIRSLEDAGVLLRRGQAIRIVPDLLGDIILAEACYDERSKTMSGYIPRVQRELNGLPLQHVVINASRVDWQVAQESSGSLSLVGSLWNAIEEEFKGSGIRARQQIMRLVQKVAYFQPDRALAIAQWAIENLTVELEETDSMLGKIYTPIYIDVLNEIPELLKNVAYNLEYLPKAADLLWELSKTDNRPTNPHPGHPIRILSDLAAYQTGKPPAFNNAMVIAAERWLAENGVEELPYSPFDILDNIMATEGSDSFSEGVTISFRPYAINLPVVRSLRDRVNALAMGEAKLPDVKRAARGIKIIGHGLSYPAGLFGRMVNDQEKAIWTPIFIETINQLADIASDTTLDPVIGIAIRIALQWHKNFSETGTKKAATHVIKALPTTVEHQLALVLHDGWGQLMFDHIRDHQAAEKRREEWYKEVGTKLVNDRRSKETVDMIESRLQAHLRAFGDYGTPSSFVWTLTRLKPEIGHIICQRIATDPTSTLCCVLPVVLAFMTESEPQKAIETSRCILETEDISTARAVAHAYGWGRGLRSLLEGEVDLLRELAVYKDVSVRNSMLRAAQLIAKDQSSIAAELLSLIRFEDSEVVAKELFSTFSDHGDLQWSDLTSEQADCVWGQLSRCPDIGDYWITEFLGEISKSDPDAVLKLLKERVEYSEANPKTENFRPLPFTWFHPLHIRDSASFVQFLREIRDWITAQPASWQRQTWGAEIFCVAARGFDDQVIGVLDEAVLSGTVNQLKAVGYILHKAPRTFVWDQVDFVMRALRTAARYGEESVHMISGGLFASATSGIRSSTTGQPFPEDIEQRNRSAELVKTLPLGSVEANFYLSLEKTAIEHIQWFGERGEQLIDGRNWD